MHYKTSFIRQTIAVAVATLLAAGPCCEAAGATDAGNSERSLLWLGKKKKKASAAETADTKSEYEKLTDTGDSTEVKDGLIRVIKKKGDYYFDIPMKLMGKEMLVVNKFVRVPTELNEAGVNRGTNYATQTVKFEYDSTDHTVRVRKYAPVPDVPAGDAIARSVSDNYISPIIGSFKVEAANSDTTSVAIKVNDLFNGKSKSFINVFSDINIGTSPNAELSRIKSIKPFSNNVYAVSELTTSVTEPGGTVNVTVEVGTTLVLLPEKPMARRYASPRIGYFTESTLQYSDRQQRVNRSHYITRWRLEPKEEEREDYLAGRLVEPAQPIVFWLDNSVPRQWRPYIKKGIEDWNGAFELAGFKNAVRVEQIPDTSDIDRDDISYSVLTYAASAKSNAMGPSITDPRTGEILEADIMWWHNVLNILHDWIVIQTGAVDPRARSLELPEDVLGDAIRFVACHEAGHSLGLRHNMMASAAIPTDSLRSPSYITELGGTSASIMDYARLNYVAQPGDGVTSLTPQIGPYDRLAIEYGYRWFSPEDNPELDHERLQELVDGHDTALYRYSEAQDSREAIDPRALSEDLGDDPVKSAKYGIANLKRVMPEIVAWTTSGKAGQDYDEASNLFYAAIGQWQRYIYHVLANIGGIYVDNATVGSPHPTYRFVDTQRQRDAVKFIIDESLTQPSWLFDADVSNYTFLVVNTPDGRMENSPNYVLKNIQSFILWDLLSDNRMIRMYENEAMNGDRAFKGSEMMDMLHEALFAKTIKGQTPDVRERSVQKNFVDALVIAASETQGVKDGVRRTATGLRHDADPGAMMLGRVPERGCIAGLCPLHGYDELSDGGETKAYGEHPAGSRILNFYGSQGNRISDAISLKRGELMRIRNLLITRMPTASREARYHYEDLVMRINTALGIAQLKNDRSFAHDP